MMYTLINAELTTAGAVNAVWLGWTIAVSTYHLLDDA
jgi:hypothetical protein